MTRPSLPEEWKIVAQDIARAWIDQLCLPVPAHGPTNIATAYQLQEAILNHLKEPIGAWKVGINPEGGVWGSPLPCTALKTSHSLLSFSSWGYPGPGGGTGLPSLAKSSRREKTYV